MFDVQRRVARSDSFAAVPDFHKLYPISRQILANGYTMATQDIVNGCNGVYEEVVGRGKKKIGCSRHDGCRAIHPFIF